MKKGISLIVVLALMLAAAIMATGVAYMISRYNQRSGLNLYSESAVAAARAGEASAKAWLTHEGEQTVNLLNAYFAQCATVAGCKPYKLPMSGKYVSVANDHAQKFAAYLVDVKTDSTNSTSPVDVKLQINAVGQDSSESIVSVIYRLKGVSYQQAPPHFAYPDATVLVPDALYVGGTDMRVKYGPTTINGSVYVQDQLELNDGLIVNGNLVFGKTSDEITFGDTLIVNGDLYVSGENGTQFGFNGNATSGQALIVNGNAYFDRQVFALGKTRIKGDAYFARKFGNPDNVWGGVKDSLIIGGNATFDSTVQISTDGKLVVNGHATFKSLSDSLILHSNGKLCVNGSALVYSYVYWPADNGTNTPGIFNGDFVKAWQKIGDPKAPVVNSSNMCQGFWNNSGTVPALLAPFIDQTQSTPVHSATTAWSGWDASYSGWATVGQASQLTAIAQTLSNGGTSKVAPFSLTSDDIVRIADSLGSSYSSFNTTAGWKGECKTYWNAYNMYGEFLKCLEEKMPTSSTYRGFIVLNVDMGVNWGKVEDFTGELTKSFILRDTLANRIVLPPTSSTGRILLFYDPPTSGSANVYTLNGKTCNAVVYTNRSLFLGTQGNTGTINGAVVVNAQSGFGVELDGGTYTYDETVINEAAVNTGLLKVCKELKADGTCETQGELEGQYVPSPKVLSLLSPRLDVELENETWGATGRDISAANEFMASLTLSPAMVSVLEGAVANVSVFDAKFPISGKVLPDSLRAKCPSASLTRGTSTVDFDADGSYLVPYTTTCSGVTLRANLVVWIKPKTVLSSSSSAIASSSSTVPEVSSSSSAITEVSSSSSEVSNAGLVFKFMYHDKTSANCFDATTASIPLDFSLYNGSIYPVNLADFRFSYFIGSSAPTTWSYTAPSVLQNMVGVATVAYDTLSRALYYDAGYNLRAVVSFESTILESKSSAASFENLVLKSTYDSNAKGDYSYLFWNRCPDALEVNNQIVVERKVGEAWTVISGNAPSVWTNSVTMTEP